MDKSLKYPDPMSACIDHIIPVNKGGHRHITATIHRLD
nr:hypothetical protein [Kallipyga massiliensis]